MPVIDISFKKPKGFYVPRRFMLTFLGFWGMFNAFAMQTNLSVAIVAMSKQTTTPILEFNNSHVQIQECPNLIQGKSENDGLEINTYHGEQFDWNSNTQGLILGSYFYGYIATQIPGGMIAEKYGFKWIFGGCILASSFLSFLTPLAASWSTAAVIGVRVLLGLAGGVSYPAINNAISSWSPKNERSRITTIIFTGAQVGNVIAMPVSGWLCSGSFMGGWPAAFYIFGIVGCVWFVMWCFLIYETPKVHPSISKEELNYIEQDKNQTQLKKPAVPWKEIYTSLPVWIIIVTHFGNDLGFMIFLVDLPIYLSTILHFDVKTNGVLSALPNMLMTIFAYIASYIADKLRSSNKMNITNIRKMCTVIGMFGPGICLIAVTGAGCNATLSVALLSLAFGINGFVFSGVLTTHVELSPEFAGTLLGITNSIASSCGFITPAIVGYFTASGATLENWSYVFYIAAAVYFFGGICFAIFGSAQLQEWGEPKEETDKSEVPREKYICTINTLPDIRL